jgi:hypothetical protein
MTVKEWNLNDYPFNFPDEPPYKGPLVNMSLIRKVDKLMTFTGTVYREMCDCYRGNAEIAIMLVALAEVDYFAGFFVGGKTKGKDYKDILSSKYFPPDYTPYIEDIYTQLRCGLLHNLVMVNPWIREGIKFKITIASTEHLHKDNEERIIFNPMTFATDIYRAFIMYANDLIQRTNEYPELVKNFERRFNRLDGRGAFMEKTLD